MNKDMKEPPKCKREVEIKEEHLSSLLDVMERGAPNATQNIIKQLFRKEGFKRRRRSIGTNRKDHKT